MNYKFDKNKFCFSTSDDNVADGVLRLVFEKEPKLKKCDVVDVHWADQTDVMLTTDSKELNSVTLKSMCHESVVVVPKGKAFTMQHYQGKLPDYPFLGYNGRFNWDEQEKGFVFYNLSIPKKEIKDYITNIKEKPKFFHRWTRHLK